MALIGKRLASNTALYEVMCICSGRGPKETCSTFLVEFSFMNSVGFRTSNYATGLVLVIRELPPIKVGQEGFGPWSDNGHDFMGGGCYFGARAPDGS